MPEPRRSSRRSAPPSGRSAAADASLLGMGALGALLFATDRTRQPSKTTTGPSATASARPVPPTASASNGNGSAGNGSAAASSGVIIPFPRSQAAAAIEAILRPLAPPDEVFKVLAGAGERGYVQPVSQRVVNIVGAGQAATSTIAAPDGMVLFAVGNILLDVGPHSPNAYLSASSEDYSPLSTTPIQFSRSIEFPGSFLLPAQINVSITITGDPDLDLVYLAHANAIAVPLDYAGFITDYLRTQVRAVDLLEQQAVDVGGVS